MPRIDDLVPPMANMSYEEQLVAVKRIREGRVTPVERNKTKKAKRTAKKKISIADMVKAMSPEERKQFLSGIQR